MNGRRALLLASLLSLSTAGCGWTSGSGTAPPGPVASSDHFDGRLYFNPPAQTSAPAPAATRRHWFFRWLFGIGFPRWPEETAAPPAPPPAVRVGRGELRVTLVNHSTFLIQMDGLNVLTDPIWSRRCSPVPWAGPKRSRPPGLRFEDLPPIDAVLVSHNHYDHLDVPTLERVAERFRPVALIPLGNRARLERAGFRDVREFDWWQGVRLSPEVEVTVVPAHHFSGRTLWDRNETLWGGFVLSGPAGNVYFAGDTGYGAHFRDIARRFAPIRLALLPIAPFRPVRPGEESSAPPSRMHLSPAQAVRAHLELGARRSLAAHFQTFPLGPEEFGDAPEALAAAVRAANLSPDAFITPTFGQGLGEDAAADRDRSPGAVSARADDGSPSARQRLP